jgi:hypothetical protein
MGDTLLPAEREVVIDPEAVVRDSTRPVSALEYANRDWGKRLHTFEPVLSIYPLDTPEFLA